MYSHILVPTDGSPLSEKAVEQALAFARDAGAKVTILSVMEPFHVFSTDTEQVSRTREEYDKYTRMETARTLTNAELRAKTLGVTCKTEMIEHNDPFQAIIDIADQKGCDLIAMASHGRRGINALLLGSVTTKVLTHSKIPVLVFR